MRSWNARPTAAHASLDAADGLDVDLEVFEEAADHHIKANRQHELGQCPSREAGLHRFEHRVGRLHVVDELVREAKYLHLQRAERRRVLPGSSAATFSSLSPSARVIRLCWCTS